MKSMFFTMFQIIAFPLNSLGVIYTSLKPAIIRSLINLRNTSSWRNFKENVAEMQAATYCVLCTVL